MLIKAFREMKYISKRFLISFITKLYTDSNVFDFLHSLHNRALSELHKHLL